MSSAYATPNESSVSSVLRWAVGIFPAAIPLFIGDMRYPFFDENGIFAVAVFLMMGNCLLALGLYFSKTVKRYFVWIKAIVIVLTVSMFCLASMVLLNGFLDRSEPVQRSLLIEAKRTIRGRGTTYEITLESWRRQGAVDRIIVDQKTYSGYREGDSIVLRVHGGAFGIPWYETPAK